MSETIFFERCQSYIDCHLKVPKGTRPKSTGIDQPPTVTISRQSGAGGITVAHQLADWLQRHAPKTACPWTVFHKNLVERVLEDHNLPQRLSQFMPEDKVSGIRDAMEELLGLHPSSWNLLRQTTQTILQLAELGNVILVGRGANVIAAHLRHAFHVRLTGSVEQRAARIQDYHKMDRKAALAYIRNTDAARRRYLRKHFQQDVDDPLLYHLVLNTDWLSLEEATELIGQTLLRRFYQD